MWRHCLYPPARPSSIATPLAWHRDFGLPAAARAVYSGPQPVCARCLPPVPDTWPSPIRLPARPRKPRAWRDILTIRLLYRHAKAWKSLDQYIYKHTLSLSQFVFNKPSILGRVAQEILCRYLEQTFTCYPTRNIKTSKSITVILRWKSTLAISRAAIW